jgi:hypothetical protein
MEPPMVDPVLMKSIPALELLAPPGLRCSETLAGYQILVAMRGNVAALNQRTLPGWTVCDDWGADPRAMALKGANMLITFHETTYQSIPQGIAWRTDVQSRLVSFALRGENRASGEQGLLSLAGFGSHPGGLEGNHDEVRAKSVVRKFALHADGSDTKVSESFEVDTGDGLVRLTTTYQRPFLAWCDTTVSSQLPTVFRGSTYPDVHDAYLEEWVEHLILSRPLDVDNTTKFEITVRVPALDDIIRGAETVAMIVRPFYARRLFVKSQPSLDELLKEFAEFDVSG